MYSSLAKLSARRKLGIAFRFVLMPLLAACWSGLVGVVAFSGNNLYYGTWCLCGLPIIGLTGPRMKLKP